MLKIGIAGARGLSTMMGFEAIEGVKVTALCDLREDFLNAQAKQYNIPHTYRVFEDMVASDIDAVVIATPMQLHVLQALTALSAGKHVLSEVTAAVTMDELWWLKEAVEKSGKTYMFAENYCYMPFTQLVKAMVEKELFGDVYYGEGEYIHAVPSLATYPDGTYTWRKYWQLGVRGTFYPTHSLGPVMQWFPGDRIKTISTYTSGHHTGPGMRQDDSTVTMCQLASGKLVKIRVDCLSPRPHNMTGYALQGTRGAFESARSDGGKHLLWLDSFGETVERAQWRDLMDYTEYLPERYRSATAEQRAAGHGGGDFFLVADFVNAIRTGQPPEIDVYKACEWTAVGLLSQLSVMNNGKPIDVPDFRNAATIQSQEIRL